MADEFLVSSEVLCRLTEKEEKWLRHQLDWCATFQEPKVGD